MSLSRRPVCAAVVVAVSSMGVLHASAATPSAGTSTVSGVVVASEDAYVDRLYPRRVTGGDAKVISGTTSNNAKTSYVKFTLPAPPTGTTLTRAALVVAAERVTATSLELRTVASNGWSEKTLDYLTRPAVSAVKQTVAVDATTRSATFDVTSAVRSGTTRSFALTSGSGVGVFSSSETASGPRLKLTYTKTAPATSPTPPPPPPSVGPTPPPPPVPATQFGMSIWPHAGETPADAVARLRQQYGSLPVARVFSSGLPTATWNDNAYLKALGSQSSVVYSFKGDMKAMAAGTYDARIKAFLASRPAGVKVWVALHHEPEDDIARGAFTAAEFRAATAHVAPVIRSAGGIPTTILMQWSLSSGSGRDWHDYYSPAVDVIAWDGYNSSAALRTPGYKSAADYLAPVLAVAKETGKSFGWAELGSQCVTTDASCSGRAAWLGDLVKGFSGAGAQFAAYWNRHDFGDGADYELHDAASVNAWKAGFRA